MKKIFVVLMAAAMLFSFASCDNTVRVDEEAVTLASGTMSEVEFRNAEGVSLSTADGKNFTVSGTLAEMTEDQAKAFAGLTAEDPIGYWQVGSQYVSLAIAAGDDATRVRCGWVSSENAAAADLGDEAFQDMKGEKAIDSSYGMILAITNGAVVRDEVKDNPVWRIEIRNGESEDVTIYTVDLSSQIAAASAEV